MKFMEAKKKLSKIAKGKYNSVKFELTENNGGVQCTLYLDGSGHHAGTTWEKAFDSLRSLNMDEAEINKISPQMDVLDTPTAHRLHQSPPEAATEEYDF